ncbi:MAG: hypothetical protein PVG90_08560 [Bacillota bacterium]|jgi:hypothetical protein
MSILKALYGGWTLPREMSSPTKNLLFQMETDLLRSQNILNITCLLHMAVIWGKLNQWRLS